MKNLKALVLFSGGLDSLLAVKILEKQGIKVVGVCFFSNFFDEKKAKIVAKKNNIDLKIIDIKEKLLKIVKNPLNGYGKNLNPCIDCHALMLKLAGKIAKKENFDIVATGEVLGQRPFSQNKQALMKISNLAGVEILRPLSAQLLPEIEIEKKGWIDRKKLGDIMGRSREKQKELIKKFEIKEYPSPAGGCILTDKVFCKRIKKMMKYWNDCDKSDVELLKNGRIFWFDLKGKNILVLIGRDKKDNDFLLKTKKSNDILLQLKNITGPCTLIRTKNIDLEIKNLNFEKKIPKKMDLDKFCFFCSSKDELKEKILLLTAYYAVKARGNFVEFDFC